MPACVRVREALCMCPAISAPPERVAGDSCARTTWESATLTSAWLQQHHPAPAVLAPSSSRSNGASGSLLPRWRSFLSTLNWRRDPGYEQRKMQHEQRM